MLIKMDDGKANGEAAIERSGHSDSDQISSSLSHSFRERDLEIELGKGTTVTRAELRSILNKQLVYVSGGLEEDKYPILTFPEDGLLCLDDPSGFKQLNVTLLYFKSLTCFADVSGATTLFLDARNSKTHNSVKVLLDKVVSKDVLLNVHVVYVYIKTGFFGRYKPLSSPEAAAKLQITYLTDQKSVLERLDSSNITTEFGGSLRYDHNNWINNRFDYDKFERMHSEIAILYPKFTQSLLDHCDLPHSLSEAERLTSVDTKHKESLTRRTEEALVSINGFLETLKGQQPAADVEMAHDKKEPIKLMSSLKLMSEVLAAKQEQLGSVWRVHEAHMKYMTQVCRFNETAEKVRVLLKEYTGNVNTEGALLGDTLESALEYGEKFDEVVTNFKTTMDDRMKTLDEDAQVLVNPSFVSEKDGKMHSATQQAIDTVKEQVEELKKTYKELTDLCQQKRDLFIVCVKFHMTTRQVQQWNQDVLEYLATLYLEEMSHDEASVNLSKIEDFSDDIEQSQLDTIAELATSLPAERQFYKNLAGNVKEKYEQTYGLLEVRKSHILKRMASLSQPREPSPIESVPEEPTSLNVPSIETPDIESESKSSTSDEQPTESTDGESDPNILKSRQFIYKELVATEKVYVEDLKTVLDSYYDAMDPNNSTSIPLRLRDKRSVVFGNLPDIHKFHEIMFSTALEQYEEHPERVGECFLKFMEEFQMYAHYCKTRNQCEALVNESTECQTFFKGMQLKLAHQLPLESYLIKPVQRITKYQLLLKDMMKHSSKAKEAHTSLKKALDGMLKVLKNLNDSLHVVGLKGFPGSLAEQGRLLVHDPLQVWVKSSTSRSLFSRARERHVFLFEKMVIFSKKTEVISQRRDKKEDNYRYKGHLTMAEIGMRKSIDGQPLQFELSLHGQQKLFTFQAPTKEVYDMWTSEIERLLEVQLLLMKEIVLKSGTLNKKKYKGKARMSILSRDSLFFADPLATESLSIPSRAKVKRTRSILSSNTESPLEIAQSLPPNYLNPTRKGREAAMSDEEFEDEMGSGISLDHYETLAPSVPRHYIATCDYNPGGSDDNGVSLTDRQEVEVIGINPYGWWWVRATNNSSGEVEEGWVPASYLRSAAYAQDQESKL